MSNDSEILSMIEPGSERNVLRVVGWFSVGMAVAGLSFLIGHELRCRYKFNRRTPYDFFSHAEGEQQTANEFGVGI